MKQILNVTLSSVVAVVVSVTSAWADKKVGLVIGNSNYVSAPSLKNPENDATAISEKLQSLGFEVIEGTNLNYDQLRDTVRDFARNARDADLTVFYYAGHGIAVDGVNYMVPVDAKMNDPVDWEFEVYALDEVLRLVERSNGPSLVFLDACRDNPMAEALAMAQGMGTRSLSTRGLSRIPTNTVGTSGSVIGYATEPGQVASDGDGKNSPFTTALLKHIGAANTDFASITSLITRDVIDLTDGTQRPRFDVSLTGPLVLNRMATITSDAAPDVVSPAVSAQRPSNSSLEIEKVLFETARESGDIADYQAYIDMFPQGAFVVVARNAIGRIEEDAQKAEETELAALEDAGTSQTSFSTSRMMNTPLILTATPAVTAIPSNQQTYDSLALNKQQRRAVQLRLNLSGNNVGRVDGAIGPGTRRGISAWQGQNGFVANGYLNAVQLQMLTANTEQAFVQHMAANPTALNPVRQAPRKATTSKRNNNNNNNNAIGSFLGGVAAGIILSR